MRKISGLLLIVVLLATALDAIANHSTLRSDPQNTNPINTSGQPTGNTWTRLREFADHEIPLHLSGYSSAFVTNDSACLHATSGSFTSAAFACEAYVPERVNQTSQAIVYDSDAGAVANDVCWVIISSDNDGIAGWSRVGSTAYYVQCEGDTTPNQPSLPSNSAWLMQIDIASSAINDVIDLRQVGILMPEQGNTHATTDLYSEYILREDAHDSPYIFSGCAPAVPGSGLTLAAFACTAFVSDSTDGLVYVSQGLRAITIADATPTWLALHKDTYSTVSGWTRSGTSHYLYQSSTTQPATPDGAIIFARVTVATPDISAIERLYPVNSFSATNLRDEIRQELGAAQSSYVYSGCLPAVPGASLSIAAFACTAFIADGSTPPQIIPVVQTSLGITVPDAASVCLGITVDRMTGSNDPGAWTGVSGTHYVHQSAACSSIAEEANVLEFAEVTVAGSVITDIDYVANRNPNNTDNTQYGLQHGMLCDGSTDDYDALMRAHDALPSPSGGKIVLPASATACLFGTTFAPTKPVWLIGAGSGISNTNDYQQTKLEYTGTGVAIDLDGKGTIGSILEGFDLDNSGTGTVGIDIDGTSNIYLRNVSINVPATPFSVAGVRLAAVDNVHTITIQNSYLRESAPVGLQTLNITRMVNVISSRIKRHSTFNIQIGGTSGTETTNEVHIFNSNFEQSTSGQPSIQCLDAQGVWVTDSHFETVGAGAYAFNVPSTATKCDYFVLKNNYFNIGTGQEYLINVNLSNALGVIANNETNNDGGGSAISFIRNQSSLFLDIHGNKLNDSVPLITGITNTVRKNNMELSTGQLDGFYVERICASTTITGNVGAGEDTIFTCTIPANTLSANDRGVKITVYGDTASNASTKQIRCYIDGVEIWDSTLQIYNNDQWHAECTFLRSSSSGMRGSCLGLVSDTNHNQTNWVSPAGNSITLSTAYTSDIAVTCTGESPAGSADDDVRNFGGTVLLVP